MINDISIWSMIYISLTMSIRSPIDATDDCPSTNCDEKRAKVCFHIFVVLSSNISRVLDRAPILWINGNCNTPSNRTDYMLKLMRYIHVDALGKCGNPTWNQTVISSDPKVLANEKMNLVQQYVFTVIIENSLEYDYVTEKLGEPLAGESVAIHLDAPNVDEWLPCSNHSCIVHCALCI